MVTCKTVTSSTVKTWTFIIKSVGLIKRQLFKFFYVQKLLPKEKTKISLIVVTKAIAEKLVAVIWKYYYCIVLLLVGIFKVSGEFK